MIHTLLKISENLDQNKLCLARDSEDKAKGFARLEQQKNYSYSMLPNITPTMKTQPNLQISADLFFSKVPYIGLRKLYNKV